MFFTLHQLKVFNVIVKHKSITKAAEELNMTQPAASIQLKNFQNQFDIPLTEIVGRQLYITEFGKEIFELSNDILEKSKAIKYKADTFKGLLSGRLKISVVSTGKYVMPYFLNGFLKKHPKVDLVLDVSNKTKVIKSLEDNNVDFSLVTVKPKSLDVEEEFIMKNKLYLVAAKESALELESKKESSIFKQIPLIYREEGSGTRFTMRQFFKKEHINPKATLELTSNAAIKQAVIADIGVSIVPLLSIKNELSQNELQIIPVKGLPLQSEWKLIWQKKKKLSPVAFAFLEYVKQEKEKIIEERFSWMNDFK